MYTKNTTNKTTIIGRVCGVFFGGVSAKGVRYAKRPVQDIKTGTIYSVTAFRELSDELQKLSINDKVSILGKKDPVDASIVADAIATDTGKSAVYESPDVKSKRARQTKEYFEKYGMVPTMIFDDLGNELTVWSAKADCVLMPDGRYKMKIEFLMDDPSLGPKRLNDIFREVTGGQLSVSAQMGKKIRDKIDQLVAERLEF
jgi:hypothetical protein